MPGLASLAPMTSTATPFPDALAKRLHAIQKLITAGELKDAALKLNAEVKRTPNEPRIYLMGMRLAEAGGNPAGALQAARRAVKATPDWPVAVTELAQLLARQNQFPEAMEMAERAVRLDGNNLEVLARVIDIAHRAQPALEKAAAEAGPAARHIVDEVKPAAQEAMVDLRESATEAASTVKQQAVDAAADAKHPAQQPLSPSAEPRP